jgi:tetratricopeptide (TPR) repeat protein/DNA-binding CsgD family transcriptional regulator
MNKILMIAAMLFFTVCQAQNMYDFKEAELKTRKLIFTKPDSALSLIKQTLRNARGAHDTVWGNTYNLYGMYYGQKGNPDSSIFYFRKSLSYIDDYPKNKVRSLLNMSVGYRNKGDYKTSVDLIEDVLEINKKIKNNTGIAMAYGELASNHTLLGEYNKSVDYLLQAIAILKAEKNTRQLVAIKQKLANTYLKTGNFKFALDLYKECLPGFKALGNDKNYYLTHLNIAEAYIQLNNLNGAKKSLKEAAAGLEKFSDKELMGITYSKLGNIERMQGNEGKATEFYEKAYNYLIASGSTHILRIGAEYINLLNNSHDHQKALAVATAIDRTNMIKVANDADKMEYHKAKAATYSATNDDKKAIEAYKKTIAMMDSISVKDKETALAEVQAKFQTELQREKNLVLEANNKALKKTVETEQRLMLAYIIGSIVVILMVLSFLRGARLRNKLQKETIKTVEAENNLIKQQREHEQQLLNTQKELINEKQRELTSKALQMANYQDSLNEIIEKCNQGQYNKISEVKKDLQLLLKHKDYWKQFETRFNNLHPEFNSTLSSRFSKLTKNDIEFCSLLKLNLSNKEIASLLQISHESAITKKYRIKKKMEINDDTEFEKLIMEL